MGNGAMTVPAWREPAYHLGMWIAAPVGYGLLGYGFCGLTRPQLERSRFAEWFGGAAVLIGHRLVCWSAGW